MKLNWLLSIILMEFIALLYIFHLLDLLDLKTGVTIGLANMGMALWAWWLNRQSESKRVEREEENRQKEKIQLYNILSSEIKINETRLHPLFEIYKEWEKSFEALKNIKLANELTFENQLSNSLDKLVILIL